MLIMRTYTVQGTSLITPSTLLLTLHRDESERPLAFQPGQYAAINFVRKGRASTTRCFSIVSSPTDQHVLQFSMRVRGKFTKALANLNKGDVVQVAGPFGGFVFDMERDKKAICMAGGIGITPFISIMRYLSRLGADNEVTLLYSCAQQDDVPFGDELLDIQKEHPNLKVIFVVGKGPVDKLPASYTATGYITPELVDHVTGGQYQGQRFFICGPPPFMKAMSDLVTKKGAPRSNILTEAFAQSSPKQSSILRSWPGNAYAMGAVGVALAGLMVMVGDLLKSLPPSTAARPTATAPFLITNARQQQLDQLVNSIAPSPDIITALTQSQGSQAASQSTVSGSANSAQSTQTLQPSAAPTFTPVYVAPQPTTTPRTTTSAPAP